MIMCVQNKLDQEARRAMKNTSIVSDIRLFERSDFNGNLRLRVGNFHKIVVGSNLK